MRQKKEQQNARTAGEACSRLGQWPVQIKLVPVKAPYFDRARLLIAADCTAYAYGAFHEEFMKDRITLIGLSQAGRRGLLGKTNGNPETQ